MCGIVGIAGKGEAAPVILEALKRLEYRGYDSAGIATLTEGRIERRRSPGKLGELARVLDKHPLAGHTGIGRRPNVTRIRMPLRAWRWCITVSSKISASCGTN
jgi:glucosamine 6-phosphate synthetase-like amidotransferase/phosphosugar isomerase protein